MARYTHTQNPFFFDVPNTNADQGLSCLLLPNNHVKSVPKADVLPTSDFLLCSLKLQGAR